MYNTISINDGLHFINQSNIRNSKTSNKLKNNKYKKNNTVLALESDDIIEGFDIVKDDLVAKNKTQTDLMNTNITGYNASMTDLNSIQSNITKQAKIFLDINKKSDDSSLRNKDVQIADGRFGRVNNAGLFKPYTSTYGAAKCGIPAIPKSTGFDLSGKSTDEYSVLEDSAGNLALFGTPMAPGPSGSYPCSDYAGTNLYVSKPINFNYDTNMQYMGVYNQAAATAAGLNLVSQPDLSSSTVKQCVTRAMDRGMRFASLSQYNSTAKTGQCHIGNVLLNSGSPNAYREITRATIFPKSATSHDAITFAADGGLYSGYSGAGGNLFAAPLITATNGSSVPVAKLSPRYGGTISEITASYAYEQGWGNWNNFLSFNASLIGTPGGSLDTVKQYNYYEPVLRTKSYQWNGGTYYYQEYEWVLRTRTSTVSWPSTGLVYIAYKCGNVNQPVINKTANLGEGFSIGCWDLYNEYPSFSLRLSDDGQITIVNNKDSTKILYTSDSRIKISDQDAVKVVQISGAIKTMMPWAERPDWVSGSINRGGLLTSYSMNVNTLTNGQYISSPTGKCRLIFNKSVGNDGMLDLQYSVYNVSQTAGAGQSLDIDNNLIGNGTNYSQYYLTKTDNASVKGKVAYININNGLHEYPPNMTGFDNDYTPMSNFMPSTLAQSTPVQKQSEALCKTACNDNTSCAGYTFNVGVNGGECKMYNASNIYPGGDRILSEGKTTYIRNKKISDTNSSHFSCNKVVNNVDSSVYSSYPTASAMTTTQKCALGLILDPRMGVLDTKNTAAIASGRHIKGAINTIYTNQNILKNTINAKSTEISTGMAGQEAVKQKIDKYEDSNITNTATVSDTELMLVSDNYQYVLWSIVTVVAGIAAIKSFRSTSI
jgi:hypothetical protein